MSVRSHLLWLVFALTFWWTSVLLTSAVEEWRQWMIFYDVHTHKPVPVINPPDNNTARIELLRMGPVPCSCQSLVCGCCVSMDIEYFDYHRNGCMNMTYDPKEFSLGANMLWNGNSVWSQSISGKNPPPACVPIPMPYLPQMDMCVRMYDIYTPGYNMHMCMNWEFRVVRSPILILEFDCFRMGQDGWANIKPGTPNGGLPSEMAGGGEGAAAGGGEAPQAAEEIPVEEAVGEAGDDEKRQNVTSTTRQPPKKTSSPPEEITQPPKTTTPYSVSAVPALSINIEEISNSSLTLPTSTGKPNVDKIIPQGSKEGGEEASAPNLNLNLHEFEDPDTRQGVVLNAPEKVIKIDIKLENSVNSTIIEKGRNAGLVKDTAYLPVVTSNTNNQDQKRKVLSDEINEYKTRSFDFDLQRKFLGDDSRDLDFDRKMTYLGNDNHNGERRHLDLTKRKKHLKDDGWTFDFDRKMSYLSDASINVKRKNLNLDRKMRYLIDAGSKDKTRNLDAEQETRFAIENTIPEKTRNFDFKHEVTLLRNKRAARGEGKRIRKRPTPKKKRNNKNHKQNSNDEDRDEKRPDRNRNRIRNRNKLKEQPEKLFAPTLSFNIVEVSQEFKSGKDKRMPPITIPHYQDGIRSTSTKPFGGWREITLTYPEPRGLRRIRRSSEFRSQKTEERTGCKSDMESPIMSSHQIGRFEEEAGSKSNKAFSTTPSYRIHIPTEETERQETEEIIGSVRDKESPTKYSYQADSWSTSGGHIEESNESVMKTNLESGIRRIRRTKERRALKIGSKKAHESKESKQELLKKSTNQQHSKSKPLKYQEGKKESFLTYTTPSWMHRSVENVKGKKRNFKAKKDKTTQFDAEDSRSLLSRHFGAVATNSEPKIQRVERSVEERGMKYNNKTESKKTQVHKKDKREPVIPLTHSNNTEIAPSELHLEPRVRRTHRGRRSTEERARKPNRKTGNKKTTELPSFVAPALNLDVLEVDQTYNDRIKPLPLYSDRPKPEQFHNDKPKPEPLHSDRPKPEQFYSNRPKPEQTYIDKFKLEQALQSVTSPVTFTMSTTTPKPVGPDIDININNLYIYLATFTTAKRNGTSNNY